MLRTQLLLATCVLSFYAENSLSQEVCRDIITYASRDETSESRANSIAQSIYDDQCQGSTYRRTQRTDIGLEAVVKAIPVTFNLGTGDDESKIDNFCKQYSSSLSSDSSSNVRTSVVVREALTAFNACIALANREVYFTPSLARTQIVIDIRRSNADVRILGVLYRPELMKCMVPGTDVADKTTVADENTKKTLGPGSFPVTCERTAQKQPDGSTSYSRVDLTIMTNRGSLLIPVPADAELPTQWSSDFTSRLNNIEADYKNKISSLEEANKAISSSMGDVPNQISASKTQIYNDVIQASELNAITPACNYFPGGSGLLSGTALPGCQEAAQAWCTKKFGVASIGGVVGANVNPPQTLRIICVRGPG